ncbi:MAG TPA: BlaI/MecI/CopY family transcriptional regulator [Pirellulales bacterium]|nr:BlaI/MecI/CopY family transcriptional regulator [Pirellulales bacterium]
MTDSQSPARVADAELAVLEVLWRREQATIREIAAQLYPGGSTSEYATVQKLLDRLESKGCVRRDRRGFAHLFSAAVRRDDLLGQRLQEVAEKLCDGSLTPLLLHLVRAAPLTSHDRDELRKLLNSPPSKPKAGE